MDVQLASLSSPPLPFPPASTRLPEAMFSDSHYKQLHTSLWFLIGSAVPSTPTPSAGRPHPLPTDVLRFEWTDNKSLWKKKKPPRLPIMPPPPRPHTKARGLAAFSTWKSQPPHHHHSFRFTFGTDGVTVPFFLLFNHPKQSPVAPRLASKPSECNDSFSKLSPDQINSLLMLLA